MVANVTLVLFALAGLGLLALAAQLAALRRHVKEPPRSPRARPAAVSILKPLCGLDDELEANLAAFADLDHPEYEVLLGVRSARDPAFAVARAAARRRPDRFRVVVQRGEPGWNPKVNQLLTLARAARHGILVISDSNVRVPRGYLAEIVALLEDEGVGLVTHPIVGVGEQRLGSVLDHLHLAGAIAPGVVAAKRLARRDIVVGKSMAMRRADLEAMGGFEAVKDVLAEDYVMGLRVGAVLGKRIEVAHQPIQNVSARRSLGDFAGRYRRWGVLQRQMVGRRVYVAQAVLNPILLATLGAAAAPSPRAAASLAAVCVAKTALDGAAARALRPRGFALRHLALVPLKDVVFGLAWLHGLVRRDVIWRGTRLRVLPGTRIEAPAPSGGPSRARSVAAA